MAVTSAEATPRNGRWGMTRQPFEPGRAFGEELEFQPKRGETASGGNFLFPHSHSWACPSPLLCLTALSGLGAHHATP
eukprot:7391861-Prymnesium_polylepis.3